MSPTTGYAAAIDSDDLILSYIAEAVWGITPDTPVFQNIRLEGEGFTGSKDRTRPNEIDPSGQASAAITTKESSVGSVNFSVSAGLATNVLLAASLGGEFTAPVFHSGSDFAVTVAYPEQHALVLTCTSGAFTTVNHLYIGQFVKLYSAGSAVNCGIGRLLAVHADSLTIDCFSGTPTVANAGAMGACTIKGSMCRNGVVVNSFTVQKKFEAALLLRYAGAFPTGGSLDVGVGDYLKGTMAFINKAQEAATTEIAGATYTAAPTRTVIDSVNGIGPVWRGVNTGTTPGVPGLVDAIVQKLGIKWNKEGAAGQYGIGSANAQGIRKGKMLVTGTMSTFFKNFILYNQFANEQKGPISFYAIDGLPAAADTEGYMITFCNASIMNPKVVAGGSGQDVLAEFDVEGNPDVSSTQIFGGKTIQIDFFGADGTNSSASASPSSSASTSTSPSHSPSSSPSVSPSS